MAKQFIVGFCYKEILLPTIFGRDSNVNYYIGLDTDNKVFISCSITGAHVFTGKKGEADAENVIKWLEKEVKDPKGNYYYLKKYSAIKVDFNVSTYAVIW